MFSVTAWFRQAAEDDEAAGLMRYTEALRFRSTLAGAQVFPLKGQTLDGGSGGGSGRPVFDYKIDCIREVNRLKAAPT